MQWHSATGIARGAAQQSTVSRVRILRLLARNWFILRMIPTSNSDSHESCGPKSVVQDLDPNLRCRPATQLLKQPRLVSFYGKERPVQPSPECSLAGKLPPEIFMVSQVLHHLASVNDILTMHFEEPCKTISHCPEQLTSAKRWPLEKGNQRKPIQLSDPSALVTVWRLDAAL